MFIVRSEALKNVKNKGTNKNKLNFAIFHYNSNFRIPVHIHRSVCVKRFVEPDLKLWRHLNNQNYANEQFYKSSLFFQFVRRDKSRRRLKKSVGNEVNWLETVIELQCLSRCKYKIKSFNLEMTIRALIFTETDPTSFCSD